MAPEKRKRPLTFGEKRRGPKPKVSVDLTGRCLVIHAFHLEKSAFPHLVGAV